MASIGKYFMHYGEEFYPPRELGRQDADRFKKELILDNMGTCRFHRKWAEEMIPEVMGSLFGLQDEYIQKISRAAARINSRNSSVFWESERNIDFVYRFLVRKRDTDGDKNPELEKWITEFEKDKHEAALEFLYEIHKGIQETLKDY